MAMLMLLDRRPDPKRLRAALLYAVDAVPRLRQRIIDAPFDLALPRWEADQTFDLAYHFHHYSLRADVRAGAGLNELFRAIGPIYLDLIVTNVPGIPSARFVAGAEIRSAYPIAPVMPHCPVSIALYGYRDHLYIGLDADATAMSLAPLCNMLQSALFELMNLPAVAS